MGQRSSKRAGNELAKGGRKEKKHRKIHKKSMSRLRCSLVRVGKTRGEINTVF